MLQRSRHGDRPFQANLRFRQLTGQQLVVRPNNIHFRQQGLIPNPLGKSPGFRIILLHAGQVAGVMRHIAHSDERAAFAFLIPRRTASLAHGSIVLARLF